MNGPLANYRAVLAYRESVPYYEPMVSRSSYSYHQGVFTFLYIEINRQNKEKKQKMERQKSLFVLD
jgi:hypothetical protein